jgi:uncharacterized damage-inducible protein DinB
MPKQISNPTTHEYAPFYSDYIERAAKRGDVYPALSHQIDELHAAFDTLTDAQAHFKPGPQEWSIKEVLGHVGDVERVFSYRLLRISRNDATPLPGFEQEDYVRESGFDERPLNDLLCEFEYQRRANILSIEHMSDEATRRYGTASGYTVSARALIYMMVGHVDHHMASLQEKYFPNI